MPNITVAKSPEAVAAAQAFAVRTGICVQTALDNANGFDGFAFCECARCEADARQAEDEIWAEGAWLREAERGDRF